jgi:hypothetical protein
MSRLLPPGRAGLIILAAAVTPIVLKKCKRLTQSLGKGVARFGEKLQEYAAEGTSPPADTPNADVKAETKATAGTTKVGAAVKGAAVTTASPTGQEEIQANVGAEAAGAPTVPQAPPRKKGAAETKTKPDQPLNPKRTAVTPPKNAAKPKSKPKKTPGESN